MGFLILEHNKTAYRADFALHGIAVLALSSWAVVECALHRFLLHGVRPFRDWSALHHHQVPLAFFGVTTHFWDQVFGSAGLSRKIFSPWHGAAALAVRVPPPARPTRTVPTGRGALSDRHHPR